MQSIEVFGDIVKDGAIVGTAWVGIDAEGHKGYTWSNARAGTVRVEPRQIDFRSIKALKADIPSGSKLIRH